MSNTQDTQRLAGSSSLDKQGTKLSVLTKKDSHASTADRDSKMNSKKISIRIAAHTDV